MTTGKRLGRLSWYVTLIPEEYLLVPLADCTCDVAHDLFLLLGRRPYSHHSPALLRRPQTRSQHRDQRLSGFDLGCELESVDMVHGSDFDPLLRYRALARGCGYHGLPNLQGAFRFRLPWPVRLRP